MRVVHRHLCLSLVALLCIAWPAWGMNKAELIDAIASDAGLEQPKVELAVETFLDTLALILTKTPQHGHSTKKLRKDTKDDMKELKKGNRISLVGFGTFSVNHEACRKDEEWYEGQDDDCNGRISFEVDWPTLEELYPKYVEYFWTDAAWHAANDVCAMASAPGGPQLGEKANFMRILEALITSAQVVLFGEGDTFGKPSEMNNPNSFGIYVDAVKKHRGHVTVLKNAGVPDELIDHVNEIWAASVDALAEQAKARRTEPISADVLDLMVTLVSEAARLSKADAGKALNLMFTNITSVLSWGGEVCLGDFGSFTVERNPVRKGRNPQTGKEIKIAAKKVVKFKAGKALADTVKYKHYT